MVLFFIEHTMENEKTLLIDRKRPSASSSHERIVYVGPRKRIIYFLLLLIGVVFFFVVSGGVFRSNERTDLDMSDTIEIESSHSSNDPRPYFTPKKNLVVSKVGFPSFLDVANKGSINVTYDSRSIRINDKPALLLGGSLHPSRATMQTWEHALDEAVSNGLNLITMYVMWEAHQPVPTKDIDWNFPSSIKCDENSKSDSCDWNLASAIKSAADRGLFVHIRVGPYDCAEYSYGGIPEWIPLQHPDMAMRRPNAEWLDVMEKFVKNIISYLDKNKLWAHQGGPIILGQIENELGGDIESETDDLLMVDSKGDFALTGLRNATLQDYANWCGKLVQELAPNVTWTMCNGLSADNTILTCNAITEAVDFLESRGLNGRIQVDQPAMFTEFEGGFQIWGEEADNPSDYFWGRSATSMAYDALRWFSRGGTHLNHYMFGGFYNRGRQAAAGITNMYASDVVLCPSGQRHHPKFGHVQTLHRVLSEIAKILLSSKTALDRGQPVQVFNATTGQWETGKDQQFFEYSPSSHDLQTVIFVENNCQERIEVKVPLDQKKYKQVYMAPYSSIILLDGNIQFDSASIDPQHMAFKRIFSKGRDSLLLDWVEWQEPIGVSPDNPMAVTWNFPIEQTKLNVDSGVYSDYAWYETFFSFNATDEKVNLYIETQKGQGMVAFVDEQFVGATDNHLHKEGPTTLVIDAGLIQSGDHKLRILSESLGYNNLIGRWGGVTKQKTKGITGDVILSIGNSINVSLVDGRKWLSHPGLYGESPGQMGVWRSDLREKKMDSTDHPLPRWSSALFDSPSYEEDFQGLFLKINAGRGHLWLNGRDLGRYWNITKGGTYNYSQQYYFLPHDYLHKNGQLNEVVLFNALPQSHMSVELILSWIADSDSATLKDGVDFPFACL